MSDKKVWLVKHPLSQYKENVKELARRNNLVIYDASFGSGINPEKVEKDAPKLTLKDAPKAEKKESK